HPPRRCPPVASGGAPPFGRRYPPGAGPTLMFTGIITAVGELSGRTERDGGLELTVATPWPDLVLGESVPDHGACLTVQGRTPTGFTAHIIRTSLDRTNFGTYDVGRKVNLERALQLGDRLGGHLVQGHVDGVGVVARVADREDARLLDLQVPDE